MEQELESNKGDKFYPGHHMWTYCIFLGKFTSSDGQNFDLGLHSTPTLGRQYSNATVYGNEPWEYSSGSITYISQEPNWIGNEIAIEIVKRANAKGIDIKLEIY